MARTLFGGPSQPEPTDERGGIQNARLKALGSDSVINPNQYENDANWESHIRWTGPQILRQIPEINVLSVGMGTSGTVSTSINKHSSRQIDIAHDKVTGLGQYFATAKPSCFRLG